MRGVHDLVGCVLVALQAGAGHFRAAGKGLFHQAAVIDRRSAPRHRVPGAVSDLPCDRRRRLGEIPDGHGNQGENE
jgi:hypothetical protein